MIPLGETAALLLCAGLSRRFGPGNKLLAPLRGRPLVAHAASVAAALPFATRVAVVPPGEAELRELLQSFGFETVENPRPEEGKDSSLRLGLADCLGRNARGIMVLLGDMPHVEPAHIRALCIAASDGQAAISLADGIGSPPTLFPAGTARDALRACERPVRQSLSNAFGVAAAAGSLADYDAPEDFGRRSAADRGCPLAAGFDVDQGSNPAKG